MAKDKKESKKSRSTALEAVSREYTIHLHKYLLGKTFKKRAPKAVKVIRSFAQRAMKTKEVRLDPALNKAVWGKGVKNVQHRIRVRLSRKRNDAEDAKEKMFTYVEHVPVASYKGLQTKRVDAADE
ncbi:ribosomal protein L31e-domain-containing protein [Hyaloraphidium curvatum]|nr:ribosomal protein L31e-domain-containing protein [Hyaloraphidium curvatum]